MRKQFNDKFVTVKAADVTASSTNNGTANAAEFPINECYSPTVVVDVASLGNNKDIAFKLQHRDSDSASWADVPVGVQTDADENVNVSATGVQTYFYAGQLARIRLVVVSKSVSPASTVRVYYQRHNLWEVPRNASF